jgi:hypothetical protein
MRRHLWSRETSQNLLQLAGEKSELIGKNGFVSTVLRHIETGSIFFTFFVLYLLI